MLRSRNTKGTVCKAINVKGHAELHGNIGNTMT
jgi:hypothetical protein